MIIPHFNDPERLEKCLRALFSGANEKFLHETEVVVIDNNSPVSLVDTRTSFSQARFIVEMQKGAAAARNRGVQETTAQLLFFLDADCIPSGDWLPMAKRAIQNSSADLIGGRIDTFDETSPPRSGAEAFETVFAFHQKDYVEKKGFSVTANLMTRRDVFERVGGFVVGVSEDLDWCLRARAQGFRLAYSDQVVVSHPTRQDWPALLKKWQRLVSEAFSLNGNGKMARVRWGVTGLFVMFSAIVHAPRMLTDKRLNGTVERMRGLATLFRLRIWRGSRMLKQAFAGAA